MRVYVGKTKSRKLIAHLNDLGFGEMTTRSELPPRRRPWAFDNGAFSDWKKKQRFDAPAFERAILKLKELDRPDFIVAPDIVAGGSESLAFSLSWAQDLKDMAPLYLAVQDGMTEIEVRAAAGPFDGLFVGGTLKWKITSGPTWVRLAHSLRKFCHIGRVGTARRVAWAKRIAADSIDSALPLWSAENLDRFVRAVKAQPTGQMEIAS